MMLTCLQTFSLASYLKLHIFSYYPTYWAADKITCVAKYHLTQFSLLVQNKIQYNSQPQFRGLQCFRHRNGTALVLRAWVLVALGCARITTHKHGPRSILYSDILHGFWHTDVPHTWHNMYSEFSCLYIDILCGTLPGRYCLDLSGNRHEVRCLQLFG